MTNSYALAITFVDVKHNQFLCLGGASWRTKRERDANLERIPTAAKPTNYVLDIESPRGIEDDRYITRETVEMLISKPAKKAISEARKQELERQQEVK